MNALTSAKRGLGLALTECKFAAPRAIQERVCGVPETADVLFGAETGSGKSLALMVPVMTRVKQEEIANAGEQRLGGRPRGIVLAPTRELVKQLGRLAKQLSHVWKVRVLVACGGSRQGEKRALSKGVDVIVASPSRIGELREGKDLFVSRVGVVACDEADTLVDKSFRRDFSRQLDPILAQRERVGEGARILMCGATLSRDLKEIAKEMCGPRLVTLQDHFLHCAARNAAHEFVRVDSATRLDALIKAAGECVRRKELVVVFCRSVDSARFVDHTLHEKGFERILSLHGRLVPGTRAKAMDLVLSGDASQVSILVTTDLMARGLDFAEWPKTTVIQFDFPITPTEYLHRAGRTARNGRHGRVISFVDRRDRELADKIQAAIQTGSSLANITWSRRANELS